MKSTAAGMAILVLVSVLASCTPKGSERDIEPQANLDPGHGCDLQFGTTKVNALFAAINQGEIAVVSELFPEEGKGEFVNQPMLEIGPSIARSLAAGHLLNEAESDSATSRRELARVLSTLSGLHFVFTVPLQGGGGLTEHVLPTRTVRVREATVAPVFWKASGQPLRQHGKRVVSGGGKIAVSCDTGRFIRVLLGPTKIQ